MQFRAPTLAAMAALALLAPAQASVSLNEAAGRYAVSPNGSAIRFSIAKLGGGDLAGAFGSFRGAIRIDGGDIARSHVDIAIFPQSVSTGQGRIDDFLRSDAVFDAAAQPEIDFHSTAVQRTGENTALVTGTMTAKGRRSAERFSVDLTGFSQNRIEFHVTGKVLRSRYGMDVGTPIYSNVVDFDMTLSGRRS